MPRVRRLGAEGEDRAADFLLGLGYTVLTRRTRTSRGELDLVCLDGETLVFVEVKSRSGRWETPEEALTAVKHERLMSAASEFADANGLNQRDQRFDLVAIDPSGVRHWKSFTG
jgi:putative endonuclease